MSLARLVISCPDRPRIVAAVSAAISDHGGNIIQSDQYSTDPEGGSFFMRVEFALADADAGPDARRRFETAFAPVALVTDSPRVLLGPAALPTPPGPLWSVHLMKPLPPEDLRHPPVRRRFLSRRCIR